MYVTNQPFGFLGGPQFYHNSLPTTQMYQWKQFYDTPNVSWQSITMCHQICIFFNLGIGQTLIILCITTYFLSMNCTDKWTEPVHHCSKCHWGCRTINVHRLLLLARQCSICTSNTVYAKFHDQNYNHSLLWTTFVVPLKATSWRHVDWRQFCWDVQQGILWDKLTTAVNWRQLSRSMRRMWKKEMSHFHPKKYLRLSYRCLSDRGRIV